MKLFKFRHLLTLPALLNIAGIAVAVAAFYILMAVSDYDLTFNKGITDHEKIYNLRINQSGTMTNIINRPLGEEFGRQLPSVESFGCLWPWVDNSLYIKREGEYRQMKIRTGGISKGLLNTFDFKIIAGDTSSFNTMDQIIVSRRNAEIFGIQLGDHLKYDLNQPDEIEVVAIYDIAPNTELQPFGAFRCIGDQYLDNDGWSVTSYFYKTVGNIDDKMVDQCAKKAIQSVCYSRIARAFEDAEKRGLFDKDTLLKYKALEEKYVDSLYVDPLCVDLIPLDKIHFAPEFDGFHEPANPKITYTFLILAIVIIIIAYINYVNFFYARVPQRIKNINTMKIFGSSRHNLVMMLVTESLLFTLVSMVISFVIVYAVAPSILGDAVDMEAVVFSNHKMLVISILLPILTSIAVSIYPALHITDVEPALALKGNVTHRHDFTLRYFLIGFQIIASTVLIIASMFIHKNVDYILRCDLGFNSQNLLAVETSQRISEHREEVLSLLLQNPDITGITWAHSELIANIRHHLWRSLPNDEELAFDVVFVADNFFDFMDIDIVEGRGFLPSDYQSEHGVYIFNKYSRDKYNMTLDTQMADLNGYYPFEVVGFCDDVKFKPLRYEMSPFAFHIPGKFTPDYATLRQLYVRIDKHANVKKTMRYIHDALTQIDPDFPSINHPVRTFQQEMMDSNYYKETVLMRMISLFAFIAILISVMGIFGIVYFETERRRKEIGIRRVNGATIWEILSLFNVKFLKISAICTAIAIPIAYFFVQKYFSGFAYHYPINVWVFVMASILTVSVTLLVVTAASFRAANENPVKTLKNDE